MEEKKILLSQTGKEAEYNEWWIAQQKVREDETLTMSGVSFFVAHDVFSPSTETTNSVDLLLRNFPNVKGKRVLDIGTGCGIFVLKEAQEGAREAVGTDVRAVALENAKKNVSDAHLSEIVKIVENERFEDWPDTFDVIIMSIIFADRPTDTSQIDELGKQSLSLHRRLLAALPRMLNPEGIVLLGFGSFGDTETLQELLNDPTLEVSCVTEEKFGVNWYAITVRRIS